jgi:hypothetical protein
LQSNKRIIRTWLSTGSNIRRPQVSIRWRAASLRGSSPPLRVGDWGLYISFFVAPTDAQQGEAYRIIFIHVPAAWMSMFHLLS